MIEFINKHLEIPKQKKHKKKYLKREERKKDKKEFKRIEAEEREKIKFEKEKKKEDRAEDKLEKKREKRKRQKQKQKEKQRKEATHIWDFMKKAEQKKKSLRKLHKKELVEKASTLKKFARQLTVEGEPGFDPKAFFNVTELNLLRIFRENRQQKVKLILKCLMTRIDLKTGEETRVEAAFHSETKINLSGTNEKKLLDIVIEEALENMVQFQRRGSNWRFAEVLKLELHLVDFVPLKGNSWIPLPEAISKKKAVINIKNEDDECFK